MINANTLPLLEELLATARRMHGREIRIASAAIPIVVVKGQPQSVLGAELSKATVLSLHHECLDQAKCPSLVSRRSATYLALFPKFGQVRCEFHTKGNIATLSLIIEEEAAQHVVANGQPQKPALLAEATPNPTVNRTLRDKAAQRRLLPR